MEQDVAIAFTALQLSIVGSVVVIMGSSTGLGILGVGVVSHLVALLRPERSSPSASREDS